MLLPIVDSPAGLAERLEARRQVLARTAPSVDVILEQVRQEGDQALRDLTARYDGVQIEDLTAPIDRLKSAEGALHPELKEAIRGAAENIRRFHEAQKPKNVALTQPDGTEVAWRWRPVDRVGAYIPGGRYPLLSTVLMNVIPARVAGVREIVVCTPPQRTGYPDEAILGTCALLGVDQVFRVGGAQAIAALAYGTETIAPVDKITGPGNAYVARAKQVVSTFVGIDMPAGPTEVVVLADGAAHPRWVAADLISQAEHDPLAWPVLVTASASLIDAVQEALASLLKGLPTRATATASLEDHGFAYLGADWTACLEAVNTIAPEHLCIQAEKADKWVDRLKAGAIFIGGNTTVAWGDYWAGPNHTLPTGGQARFQGPLSVYDYLAPYSTIKAPPEAVDASGAQATTLAKAEGLAGHALSITVRRDDA